MEIETCDVRTKAYYVCIHSYNRKFHKSHMYQAFKNKMLFKTFHVLCS